ncbi:MAG TPA: hypothetical protein VGO00_22875, partial [Kofleriaceae bacterium]|nr:hypothetical protein [Kofleriaceae bacterium]
HMSCTLLAPIGLVGAIFGVRESTNRVATVVVAVVAFVVGFVPYVYLFVTSGSAAAWGPVSSLDDLVGVITRRDYGGAFAFASSGTDTDTTVARNLWALAVTIGRSWLWVPAIAGVVAIGVSIARPGNRLRWLGLAASLVLAGPFIVGSFNVAPESLGLYVCQRFHLLPVLLLCIPTAIAFEAGLSRVRLPSRAAWVAPLVVVITAATSLPYVSRVRTTSLTLLGRNALRSLPPDAIVIVRSDDTFYAQIYVQELEGERTDVTIVSWWLIVFPWYRERLAKQGLVLDPYAATPGPWARRIAHQIWKTKRPLFTETQDPRFGPLFDAIPYGIFVNVPPPGALAPSLGEIVAKNRSLYAAFDLSDPRPGRDDEYPTAVHSRYAFTWLLIAKALVDAGHPEDAKAAIAVAREIGPQP